MSSVAIRPPKLAQADAGHLIDEVLKTELLVDNAGSVGRLDSRDRWRHTVDTLLNRRLEYSVMVKGEGMGGEGDGGEGRGGEEGGMWMKEKW